MIISYPLANKTWQLEAFCVQNQLSTYIFTGFSFHRHVFQKAHPAKSMFNKSKKWHVAIETSFQTQPFPSIPTRIDSVVLGVCFHIGIRQVVVIDIIATWTYKYHDRGETCQELWYFVIGLLLSIGKIGVYGQRNESWIMWTISKLTWPHGIQHFSTATMTLLDEIFHSMFNLY